MRAMQRAVHEPPQHRITGGSIRRRCVNLVFLLLLAAGTSSIRAQVIDLPADSVQLDVSGVPDTLTTGQTFIVEIVAYAETPVFGFGLQVEYDPQVVEVFERPDADGIAVPFILGNLFEQMPQRVKNADEAITNSERRQVDVVYTLLPPSILETGQGVLGSVAFTIVGEGQAEILLKNPRLIGVEDGNAVDNPVTLGVDTITVNITGASGSIARQQPQNAPVDADDNGGMDANLLILAGGIGIGIILALIIVLVVLRRRPERARDG